MRPRHIQGLLTQTVSLTFTGVSGKRKYPLCDVNEIEKLINRDNRSLHPNKLLLQATAISGELFILCSTMGKSQISNLRQKITSHNARNEAVSAIIAKTTY